MRATGQSSAELLFRIRVPTASGLTNPLDIENRLGEIEGRRGGSVITRQLKKNKGWEDVQKEFLFIRWPRVNGDNAVSWIGKKEGITRKPPFNAKDLAETPSGSGGTGEGSLPLPVKKGQPGQSWGERPRKTCTGSKA